MSVGILLLAAHNTFSLLRSKRIAGVSNTELFLQLLIDVALLTGQLYLSGGAINPFISLFLLQVILASVLLETRLAWMLVAITSACYVGLTFFFLPIDLPHHHNGDLFNLHIQGMFISFILAAILLVLFTSRISQNHRDRDAHLADLRQRSAEEDHIVRMGLLASGAAHELGTPLATLSVILNDWQHDPSLRDHPERVEEISEMQSQLARCKAIVSGILISSGQARGEGTIRTTLSSFFDEIVDEWKEARNPTCLEYRRASDLDEDIISDTALRQVLFNLFDNALEASPEWIGLDVDRRDNDLRLTVRDRGPGFEQEMLTEFGKPYRSSKSRPGTGLGLFLVVNVIRKLGGTVTALNNEGRGARVTVMLPVSSLEGSEQ